MPARSNDPWELKFGILVVFQRSHGHCDVPRQSHANSLFQWLAQQRLSERKGTLSSERAARLRKLGVVFDEETGDAREERWEMRFAELTRFRERFGHCDVPAKWKENKPLGRWLNAQRERYRAGLLDAERLERLEKLGVKWAGHGIGPAHPSDVRYSPFHILWETRFAELLEWKATNFRVPPAANPQLQKWVTRQRENYRAGRLSKERQERLQAIGFPWEAPGLFDDVWEQRFKELLEYRTRFGHCNVPCKWKENKILGHWVHVQREFRRKGKLRVDRIDRLEDIGFAWLRDDLKHIRSGSEHYRVIDLLWEARFTELKRFQRSGFVVRRDKDPSLCKWIIRQRVAHNNGTLLAEREQRLEEIGFPWNAQNPRISVWEERFGELLKFKKRFGHCNVPSRWQKNLKLGRWVSMQREFRQAGKLSDERIHRLEELGFEWNRKSAPRLSV
jgi:hypothetical protein